MGKRRLTEGHCQAGALRLLGDYVTLRVIDFLRGGELRFTQLQRSMGDVNSVTLSSRLKRLELAGVIGRKVATVDKRSVAYSLTELGKGLLPVLREVQKFTLRNASSQSDAGVPRAGATRKRAERPGITSAGGTR